jgi:hypothetical protein
VPLVHSTLALPSGLSRAEIRSYVVIEFLKEVPGTGNKANTSRYLYEAETLSCGKKILLKRPAILNRGMDFTVHLQSTIFRPFGPNRDMPRHAEIIELLQQLKNSDSSQYESHFAPVLASIADCRSFTMPSHVNHSMSTFSPEALFMILKWFFIEQDVTYWNWSGRQMLIQQLKIRGLIA